MSTPTLVPAYGRDYRSRSEVIRALVDGQDFLIHANAFDAPELQRYDRKPINLSQLRDGPRPVQVRVRFNDLRDVTYVTLADLVEDPS